MSTSLFHKTGEDRVESATLAVLSRTDLSVARDVLADAGGIGDQLQGVRLAVGTMRSAARLTARVDWSFEVLTTRGAYDHEGPARDRLRRLAAGLHPGDWLFVLTPDPPAPAWLAEPDGIAEAARSQIVWMSFAWLAAAVRDALSDPDRVVDARSRVLLAELVSLYDVEGLLDVDEPEDRSLSEPGVDTLLVTDDGAWSTYLDHAAYVCHAEGELPSEVRYVAFHHQGRIMAVIPRIVQWHTGVELTQSSVAALRTKGWDAAALVVQALTDAGARADGPVNLALLTPAGDPATVRLAGPVADPGTTEHRLTSLESLGGQ